MTRTGCFHASRINRNIPTNRLRPPIGCPNSSISVIGLISALRHEQKAKSCCDWMKSLSGCKSSEKRIQVAVGRRWVRRALFTVSSATRLQSSASGKLVFKHLTLGGLELNTKTRVGPIISLKKVGLRPGYVYSLGEKLHGYRR